MNNLIQLSVVIVEYRCAEQIEGCLPTLKRHLGSMSWECIVISNSEYSVQELKELGDRLPGAKIIANDRNRGYAGGVNRALPECQAPFIFVLNPDCRLMDDKVSELINALQTSPEVAAIGPRVIDGKGVIQPSCRRFPKPWTFLMVRSMASKLPGAWRERRRYLMEEFDHGSEIDVDWISGGAMLVRRSAIDAVGPMDERFFLYMEDVDWCRRFWQAKWRVLFSPVCTVCHDAQHDSLRGGLRRITSPHTWFHLTSLVKYFLKHGVSKLDRILSNDTQYKTCSTRNRSS